MPYCTVTKSDDNYRYLNHLRDSALKDICAVNRIDPDSLNRQEKIDALYQLPAIKDPFLPPPVTIPTPASTTQVGMFHHLRSFYPLDESKHDFCSYLDSFERQCVHQDIPQTSWPVVLEPYLSGTAQRTYDFIPNDLKSNWTHVKAKLLKAYNLTPEAYRYKFRMTTKRAGMTFEDTASQLSQHLRRWLEPDENLLKQDSFQVILEKLVIDQLIDSILDPVLKLKLRECPPRLNVITEMADNYVQFTRQERKSSSTDHKIKKRDDDNHKDKAVTPSAPWDSKSDAPTCYRCHQTGHMSYECKMNGPSSSSSSSNRAADKSDDKPSSRTQKPSGGNIGHLGALTTLNSTSADPAIMTSTHALQDCIDGAYIQVYVNGLHQWAFADLGAAVSIISKAAADDLGLTVEASAQRLSLIDRTSLTVHGNAPCKVRIAGTDIDHSFIIADISTPVLIGRDLILHLGLTFDFSSNTFGRPGFETRYPLVIKHVDDCLSSTSAISEQQNSSHSISDPPVSLLPDIPKKTPSTAHTEPLSDSHAHESELEVIFSEFTQLFRDEPGCSDIYMHCIETNDAPPVRQKPYRMSPKKREAAQRQVSQMLANGIIQESTSPYCSSPVLVEKPSGDYRFAIDFRSLNDQTQTDSYPLPTIESILSNLNGAKIFTKLDLRSAF